LFETLSEAPGVWTVGGESHGLIEGLRPLNPMSGQVDSNRLDATHASERIVTLLRRRFADALQDRDGNGYRESQPAQKQRFLEKTPKNALRQPFLEEIFPGALYIYLFRDPRPNISSMMEAWKARGWVTYPRLKGWRGPPWSLLLPPGWQALSGRPLPEICAFQWAAANRIILDDLSTLPADRRLACDYADLTGRTEETVRKICSFTGLEVDQRLEKRISGELPASRYTHTAPDPDKWRKNEAEILEVLDSVSEVWERARAGLLHFPFRRNQRPQRRHHLVRRGNQRTRLLNRILAVEIQYHAPGFAHQQRPGRDVPGFQSDLEKTVHPPRGHPGQVQAGRSGAAEILDL